MLAACLGDEEVVLLLVGGVGPEQQPVLQEARAGRPDEVRNGIQLMKIATKGGEGVVKPKQGFVSEGFHRVKEGVGAMSMVGTYSGRLTCIYPGATAR